ncbi:nucleotide exchange factor GrpE [Maricaulis sp.]|uniref:nucleotide exchange factor GrpE n=1 Tax=Maricaulis sp. TaxID=1486257 RepID=UPI002635D615|nr:nucleotide exchange factor GrpE [Maricaulis sp.]
MSETDNNETQAGTNETAPEAETDTQTAGDGAEAGSGETTPEEAIAKLTAELDAMRDKLLRALAEAENTRRRAEKEVKDTRDYAVSSFAKDMLDVADNLSRAIGAVDQSQLDDAPDAVKNLVEGVEMTEKAMLSKMERHGVKKVDPAPGDAFDPHLHQAVAQIPSDQPSGKIASVMQTGFVIGQRTLRAAMVAVSAGSPSGDGDGGPQAPGDGVDVKA